MTLGPNPPDDEVLAFVARWIELLAAGDFDAAWATTEHDPYYGWTPELMRRTIEGFGHPEPHPSGRRFRVTPPADATGKLHWSVDREGMRPPIIARVAHDLPLDGEWSDLSVTFRIESRGESSIPVLEEIHVF